MFLNPPTLSSAQSSGHDASDDMRIRPNSAEFGCSRAAIGKHNLRLLRSDGFQSEHVRPAAAAAMEGGEEILPQKNIVIFILYAFRA